jgi:hypothetical protein
VDVGLREAVVAVLQSYEPEWLKLGLETVLGEEIHTKSSPAAMVAPLRKATLEVCVQLHSDAVSRLIVLVVRAF